MTEEDIACRINGDKMRESADWKRRLLAGRKRGARSRRGRCHCPQSRYKGYKTRKTMRPRQRRTSGVAVGDDDGRELKGGQILTLHMLHITRTLYAHLVYVAVQIRLKTRRVVCVQQFSI